MNRTAAIRAVLDTVPDPEIPVLSVTDLGIVREVTGDKVVITPTYSGCPATIAIEKAIREALSQEFPDVAVETVISPPWSSDWITQRGRQRLLDYGIAPPSEARTATCPQCASEDTVEVSRFGSTPCKALWRCRACAEPFDRFKCH